MTGSTYIEFNKAQTKGFNLIKSGQNPTFGLLIIVGINLGLRISDLLKLSFKDLRSDSITITEGKTKKVRMLKVNHNIQLAIKYFDGEKDNFNCFISQKGSVYSIQQVNRLMKQYFNGDTTSHSLRKTFGRQVWNNYNCSEKALVYLSELFNHTSINITRKYLGIRQEELDDIYMNL